MVVRITITRVVVPRTVMVRMIAVGLMGMEIVRMLLGISDVRHSKSVARLDSSIEIELDVMVVLFALILQFSINLLFKRIHVL